MDNNRSHVDFRLPGLSSAAIALSKSVGNAAHLFQPNSSMLQSSMLHPSLEAYAEAYRSLISHQHDISSMAGLPLRPPGLPLPVLPTAAQFISPPPYFGVPQFASDAASYGLLSPVFLPPFITSFYCESLQNQDVASHSATITDRSADNKMTSDNKRINHGQSTTINAAQFSANSKPPMAGYSATPHDSKSGRFLHCQPTVTGNSQSDRKSHGTALSSELSLKSTPVDFSTPALPHSKSVTMSGIVSSTTCGVPWRSSSSSVSRLLPAHNKLIQAKSQGMTGDRVMEVESTQREGNLLKNGQLDKQQMSTRTEQSNSLTIVDNSPVDSTNRLATSTITAGIMNLSESAKQLRPSTSVTSTKPEPIASNLKSTVAADPLNNSASRRPSKPSRKRSAETRSDAGLLASNCSSSDNDNAKSRVNSSGSDEFRCRLCNYSGRSQHCLSKHYRAHDLAYKICRYCRRAFERPSDLLRHEERHRRRDVTGHMVSPGYPQQTDLRTGVTDVNSANDSWRHSAVGRVDSYADGTGSSSMIVAARLGCGDNEVILDFDHFAADALIAQPAPPQPSKLRDVYSIMAGIVVASSPLFAVCQSTNELVHTTEDCLTKVKDDRQAKQQQHQALDEDLDKEDSKELVGQKAFLQMLDLKLVEEQETKPPVGNDSWNNSKLATYSFSPYFIDKDKHQIAEMLEQKVETSTAVEGLVQKEEMHGCEQPNRRASSPNDNLVNGFAESVLAETVEKGQVAIVSSNGGRNSQKSLSTTTCDQHYSGAEVSKSTNHRHLFVHSQYTGKLRRRRKMAGVYEARALEEKQISKNKWATFLRQKTSMYCVRRHKTIPRWAWPKHLRVLHGVKVQSSLHSKMPKRSVKFHGRRTRRRQAGQRQDFSNSDVNRSSEHEELKQEQERHD